ncbi:MAG: DUF4260 domain-containing protein [Flavobacteriales bacterium]|nr:DUF4260 domain-containing protein [Flavobacteriales bacterium]
MKTLLRLEELAQFFASVFALYLLGASWWVYLVLVLDPDVGMLGYLMNTRVGAITYNLLHHKGLAMLLLGIAVAQGFGERPTEGMLQEGSLFLIGGLILYGHASMDRIFGYGLKFGDNFHHTHLGWIGKRFARDEPARSE